MAILLCGLAIASPLAVPSATVTRVVGGDTIVVMIGGREQGVGPRGNP
jgi:hypothetical protein